MSSPQTPAVREVSLGARPKSEREFIPPGDPQYAEIAMLDAFTFKRYLDRTFWYPRREVLRFEVRAMPSPTGSIYDVVALVASGEGEAWFSEAAVPARWDYVAISETSHGLSKMQTAKLKAEGKLPADYEPFGDDGPVLDHSNLENPEEVDLRRWDVVNRVREASRQRRATG
ncbi:MULTISPECIES: hypothetical protein [Cupriavidus]|uniref:Uncharacterized protein n=1 Tax=Cupriavidus basilensis TaxID=68895 RepID=A0A643FRX0_9BURK|nr:MULTISPECIES: hypothetical protein [Cupriavidus]KUE86396.1 hypothetical protein ASL20_23315 [Cupriavidus necator]NOV23596.1 hypothetical protein [Cupriavidus necator]QOT81670.1 hypothetical protein F7R26_037275 [Cupriavidus basilensis]BDB30119.1 hypothetical protein CTP10_R75360 [Cupriavidus sp. P-10]